MSNGLKTRTALDKAVSFLRSRGKYVLDKDTPKPNWGRPDDLPAPAFERTYFTEFPEVTDECFNRVDIEPLIRVKV